MKKILTIILLPLFILSCGDAPKLDPCLEALEVISINELSDGSIKYEVIGMVRTLSKGAHDFEQAMKQTLNLPDRVVAGCLVFEENHDEYFGFFMFDSRQPLDYSSIKLKEKAKVSLLRVELDEIIPCSFQNQKRVQYLYLIQDIEPIPSNN